MRFLVFIVLAVVVCAQPVLVTGDKKVVLTAEAEGTKPFTYQWYRNNVKVVGEISEKLIIADPKATGVYHCVISNSAGETKTPTVRLANTAQADAAIVTITRK